MNDNQRIRFTGTGHALERLCVRVGPMICVVLGLLLSVAGPLGAAEGLENNFKQGLFEEEGNRNLKAAIAAYQAALTQFDKDRQIAATAIFRLAECYRKLGQTNEATAQYQRILREFSDQTQLVELSRKQMPAAMASTRPPAGTAELPEFSQRLEQIEIDNVRTLIKDSPDLLHSVVGPSGRTRLHNAADKGQVAVAGFLLDNGANIEARDQSDDTPLLLAVGSGHKSMVEFLLKRGASVNVARRADSQPTTSYRSQPSFSIGSTPLHLSLSKGFRSITEALLEAGADVNARVRYDATPLHYAVSKGDVAMVRRLIASKADVNAKGYRSDVTRTTRRGRSGSTYYELTPLHLAADSGEGDSVATAQALLDAGALVDSRDRDERTPLHAAAAAGKDGLVRLLLERGANPNVTHRYNETPLHRAVSASSRASVEALLARGAKVDILEGNSNSPLLLAIEEGNKEILDLLLHAKADPNLAGPSSSSTTPLLLAIGNRNVEGVGLLLKNGADPERKGVANESTGKSHGVQAPLQFAILLKEAEIAKLLLEHKANASVANDVGYSVLHAACDQPSVTLVRLLLQYKANPNAMANRETPLKRIRERISQAVADLAPSGNPRSIPSRTLRVGPPVPGGAPSVADATLDLDSTKARQEIEQLLLQHGADEHFERRRNLAIGRDGALTGVIFWQDEKQLNRHTLLELLAEAYSKDRQPWQPSPLPFPDLKNMMLKRLPKEAGQPIKEIFVNGEAIITGDEKDIALEWGDLVEIPEEDHPINVMWPGFAPAISRALRKAMERTVTLVHKGQTVPVTLLANIPTVISVPSRIGAGPPPSPLPAQPLPPSSDDLTASNVVTPAGKSLYGFRLRPMVRASGVLRTSSDLSKITVKRKDSAGQVRETVADITEEDKYTDVWLRDGDVIEIPDKPAGQPDKPATKSNP